MRRQQQALLTGCSQPGRPGTLAAGSSAAAAGWSASWQLLTPLQHQACQILAAGRHVAGHNEARESNAFAPTSSVRLPQQMPPPNTPSRTGQPRVHLRLGSRLAGTSGGSLTAGGGCIPGSWHANRWRQLETSLEVESHSRFVGVLGDQRWRLFFTELGKALPAQSQLVALLRSIDTLAASSWYYCKSSKPLIVAPAS